MGAMKRLKAPFPYFGGKSVISGEVWKRFGKVNDYVEPFFGSGAILLANPNKGIVETVNDKDHFIANFWRAVKHDPEAVAHYADRPVIEIEKYVNEYWLITDGKHLIRHIETDRDFYDAEVAGVWLWGMCISIGLIWCDGDSPWIIDKGEWVKRDNPEIPGIIKNVPHLRFYGRGINVKEGQLNRKEFIKGWIEALSNRLRSVRVCCGDWKRVVTPNVIVENRKTAIFLDPPYSVKADRREGLYREDDLSVAEECAEWAMKASKDKNMLIAFCGYEDEHAFPDDWVKYRWKAQGGYGNLNKKEKNANKHKECVWFSPNCNKGSSGRFFDL